MVIQCPPSYLLARIGAEKWQGMIRWKFQSLHMLSTQSQTVFGILSYTSVRTTGPTMSFSLTAAKDSAGVSKSAKSQTQHKKCCQHMHSIFDPQIMGLLTLVSMTFAQFVRALGAQHSWTQHGSASAIHSSRWYT